MSTACWHARRRMIPAAWSVRSSPAVHPWAIVSAALAPILLTGAYLIAGIFQPASYRTRGHQPGKLVAASPEKTRPPNRIS